MIERAEAFMCPLYSTILAVESFILSVDFLTYADTQLPEPLMAAAELAVTFYGVLSNYNILELSFFIGTSVHVERK